MVISVYMVSHKCAVCMRTRISTHKKLILLFWAKKRPFIDNFQNCTPIRFMRTPIYVFM